MQPFEPITWDELPATAKALLPADTPPAMKMIAARSLLPMGTIDLVSILFYLAADEDRRIRRMARKSLVELPPDLIKTVLAENVSPKILHWFAHRDLPEELYENIVLNRTTDDQTLAVLAGNLKAERLLSIISINQQRLLRSIPILAALMDNRHTPLEIRERVKAFVELETGRTLADLLKPLEPEESPETEAMADAFSAVEETAPDEAALSANLEAIPEDELPPDFNLDQLVKEAFQKDDDFSAEFLVDPEEDLSANQRTTLANRIRKMRVLDKMRLALKGNIEARQLLVKNSNKMVQECVLRNPRITAEEVIRLAKDKTTREELVRQIAGNKEWTKNYQILNQLCWNPKTPITMALKFIQRLNLKEVNAISKSKQVPGMLAVAARKVLESKQKYR